MVLSGHERLRIVSGEKLQDLELMVSHYQGGLPVVADRLVERGILPETQGMFRLGFVHDPLPGHEFLRDHLVIPYLLPGVGVVQTRFRCMGHVGPCEDHPKYRTLSGDQARLWNAGVVSSAGRVLHVCEGELDAMVLCQLGLPAAGVPGAGQWRGRHAVVCAGFDRVFVWGDPDKAGREFTDTVCSQVRNGVPVGLTVGDVGETYTLLGEDGLWDVLRCPGH